MRVSFMLSAGSAHPAGRELHGLDDLRIGGAATEIAREVVPDLVLVGIRMLLEQLPGHQQEAGRTEAALERAAFDERLLQRAELAVSREVLDRDHLRAVREGRQEQATRHGSPVDQHRTATAQAL